MEIKDSEEIEVSSNSAVKYSEHNVNENTSSHSLRDVPRRQTTNHGGGKMNKPFYTEYVRHALRFYSRNLTQPHFKKDVDKENWLACHNVISQYSDRDRDILIYVYSSYDTLADNVYTISKKYHIRQNIVWDMMKEFEREIAKKRGLL